MACVAGLGRSSGSPTTCPEAPARDPGQKTGAPGFRVPLRRQQERACILQRRSIPPSGIRFGSRCPRCVQEQARPYWEASPGQAGACRASPSGSARPSRAKLPGHLDRLNRPRARNSGAVKRSVPVVEKAAWVARKVAASSPREPPCRGWRVAFAAFFGAEAASLFRESRCFDRLYTQPMCHSRTASDAIF
mgnify:CR=1 FL=1